MNPKGNDIEIGERTPVMDETPVSPQRISVGELFTGSLFCIPALILHNHGFIVNSLLTWMVFAMSLIFHRHNIESVMQPNKHLRLLDITITVAACTALVVNGYDKLNVMLPAVGTPLFYIFEKITLNRNGDDGALLFGPAGWHMLLHISAIVSSCFLAFTEGSRPVPAENDIEAGCFGLILSCFFFVLFQPRKFGKAITSEEMLTILLGTDRNGNNGCIKNA
jgi:hypothetical protein